MIANKDGGVSARDQGRFARLLTGPARATEADRLEGDGRGLERLAARPAARRGLLGRRARRRHDPRVGICLADGLSGPARRSGLRQGMPLHSTSKQRPDGGWAIYPGGPCEVSASVKAYFALKLLGVSPDDPAMRRARQAILAAVGRRRATASRGFTSRCWARSITTTARACRRSWCWSRPGSISALRRCRPGPGRSSSRCRSSRPTSRFAGFLPELGVSELFRADLPRRVSRRTPELLSWANIFLAIDRMLKWADRWLPGAGDGPASRRRTAGCSSTSRTPTAWARSSRR